MHIAMCRRCKKCCHDGGGFLSGAEAEMIERETGQKCITTQHGDLFRLGSVNGHCQFLGEAGGVLEDKPLACEIYPFLPTMNGWVIRTACPHWWKFHPEDLVLARASFEKRKEHWKSAYHI